MIPKTFTQEIRLNDGRTITLETGKLAKQAHGSVVVTMGNCMLFVHSSFQLPFWQCRLFYP